MCGIAGVISYKFYYQHEEILERMNKSLHHRGPDGGNIKTITNDHFTVGLTHRRLSIIDTSNLGAQPMNLGQYWICFNGEIYNFEEIKNELNQLAPHPYKSMSDTEVVLHAYSVWGEKCVDKFVGMFAFVIYDVNKQRVFCARDRAGVKPFFYYYKDGLFLFASELKAICQHPGFEKQLNFNALPNFFRLGYIPDPDTIYNYTHKLKPGHCFSFDVAEIEKTDWQPRLVKYWDVTDYYNLPKLSIDYQEAKEETIRVLHKAFNYRMVANVPVGIFLSGGYDSTCVTSILQSDKTEKLKTFTISVEGQGMDEGPYAKAVAQRLGTDHTEIKCTSEDAIAMIENLPYYYDEPFGDSSVIPTSLVCKSAREFVTVALGADGGDEVFAGYNRYEYLSKFNGYLQKVPKTIRNGMVQLMNSVPVERIPYLKNKYNFAHRYEKLKGLIKNTNPGDLMWSLMSLFDDEQINRLLLKPGKGNKSNFILSDDIARNNSLLSQMMMIDYRTYMIDDIMQKVDRASMSASLEAREPFLDHNIIQWAAQLPDEYKYNKGIKKYIVRDIVHDHIPAPMMERHKMGFSVPTDKWLLVDLKEYVDYYLDPEKIKRQRVLNEDYVTDMLQRFRAGSSELAHKIWYILMFQMWYAHWMES